MCNLHYIGDGLWGEGVSVFMFSISFVPSFHLFIPGISRPFMSKTIKSTTCWHQGSTHNSEFNYESPHCPCTVHKKIKQKHKRTQCRIYSCIFDFRIICVHNRGHDPPADSESINWSLHISSKAHLRCVEFKRSCCSRGPCGPCRKCSLEGDEC